VGELVDDERHEIASKGGISAIDDLDELVVKDLIRPGYIHSATGSVLCPALVNVAPAAKPGSIGAAASLPPQFTPRGTRVHVVSDTDTLAGLAIRYGTSQAAIMRLNRLPNAQSVHARKQLRIPLAQPTPTEMTPNPSLGYPRIHTESAAPASGVAPQWVVSSAHTAASSLPSLASQIASRRQNNGDRRRWAGGAELSSISGVPLQDASKRDQGKTPELVPQAMEVPEVAVIESALKAALAVSAEGTIVAPDRPLPTKVSTELDGSSRLQHECIEWIHARAGKRLAEVTTRALLVPWRSMTPTITSSVSDVAFLRALGSHAHAERALLSILGRDGALLRDLSATLASSLGDEKAQDLWP